MNLRKTCLLLLILSACAKSESPSLPQPQKSTAQQEWMQEHPFRLSVNPTPTPHHYQVKIDWPEITSRPVFLYRESFLLVGPPNHRSEFHETVHDNQTLNYVAVIQGNLQEGDRVFRLQAVIPKDALLSGKMILLDDLRIQAHRLFIENLELTAFHQSVSIDVDEIESKGGQMVSYPVGAKDCFSGFFRPRFLAPSAGHFLIRAKKASGPLQIMMKGEDGCQDGRIETPSQNGSLWIQIEDAKEFQLSYEMKSGVSGVGMGQEANVPGPVCLKLGSSVTGECEDLLKMETQQK